MMVEKYAKCDALDMTWVRFRSICNSLREAMRIDRGMPMTPAEHIEKQQAEKSGYD